VVPQECLVLTMRTNQKYFPLFDAAGKLTNRFLIVSNMRLADPKNIVDGNNRVVRPRLADARFFFETTRRPAWKRVCPARIYRLSQQAGQPVGARGTRAIARGKNSPQDRRRSIACRTRRLAGQADLVTSMVGEFPELQGIMGRYYARATESMRKWPKRWAINTGFDLAGTSAGKLVSTSLFIADRVETLVGIWGIGLKPSGDKDPFGLRRAALGLINGFELLGATARAPNQALALRLDDLLRQAAGLFNPGIIEIDVPAAIMEFVYERTATN